MLKDAKIVEVRRKKLQTYLRLVVVQLSRDFPELVDHACRQTLVQTVPFFSYVLTHARFLCNRPFSRVTPRYVTPD